MRRSSLIGHRNLLAAILVVAGIVLAAGWFKTCQDIDEVESSAERRVQAFKDSLSLMRQRDTVRLQVIDSLQGVEKTALDSVIIYRPGQERIVTVLQTVEDTTARRALTSLIDSLNRATDQCLVAVGACRERADSLAEGWAAARRLLSIADANQDSTLADIRGLSRGFNLKPEVGIGGFGGICTNGKPCAGVGLTVNWSLPWF